MLNEVSCPKCQAKLRSNNDLTGKTVRCSKCQERFRAAADAAPPVASQGDTQMLSAMDIAAMKPVAKPVRSALEAMDDLPELDAMPAAKPVVKAVAKVVTVAAVPDSPPAASNAFAFDEAPEKPKKRRPADEDDDEDEEDEEPRPKKKKRTSDEEEDTVVDEVAPPTAAGAFSFDDAPEPAKKKSKRRIDDDDDDDEEEDERPRKARGKPAKSGAPVMLLAGLAVGFLVLAGGGVAAYFLLFKKSVAKAPTSAAAVVPVAPPDTKATKAGTKSTGATEPPPTKPETPGKKPPPKVNPKNPPTGGGPKIALPKAPTDPMLASVVKEKFTIDVIPENIKAFRIVGSGLDRRIFIARNSFAGFQGQGAIDTIDCYAIDTGAKIGGCDVKADGIKWPRPFEPSPDGKHILIEGPVGKFNLYAVDEKKFLIDGVDPFMGNANRKGPLKGLNWKGNDSFWVSDHNGSTDEWTVAEKKMKKAGPSLPDAPADAKVVVSPLDESGSVLAVLRDSQVFVLKGGNQSPATLPDANAVPIALDGSTLADRLKMAVVAQIKDTTQHMVYIMNFKDQIAPISIRLPDGIGTVTDIGWQSVDSLIVTIEGGAASLIIDLEEQFPVAYVKSTTAKAQMFSKASFNSLWYAVADAAGKTQITGVNLDFDGYKKMAEDAKGAKVPVFIVPSEKGISK